MACDYCNGMNTDDPIWEDSLELENDESVTIDVYIHHDRLCIFCSANMDEQNFMEIDAHINYCPMCGEKLSKKTKEEPDNIILANGVNGKLEDLFPRNFVVTDAIAKSIIGASIKNSEGDIIGVIDSIDLKNGEWTGKAIADTTYFQSSSSMEIKGEEK